MCLATSQRLRDFKSLTTFVAQSRLPFSRPVYISVEGMFTATAPTVCTQRDTEAPAVRSRLPLISSRFRTGLEHIITYWGVL